MTISPLTPDDREEWLALWAAYLDFYESELSAAQTELTFARLTDPDDTIHGVIARSESGEAIGLVHWLTHPSTWSQGPYCYLEDLFVDPGARGGGTGAALIAHVRAWAESAGCEKVYWLTQVGNARARQLYDRVAADTGFMHYEIDLAATAPDAS
jgi:GNAT superfamily N-acetyltransferase